MKKINMSHRVLVGAIALGTFAIMAANPASANPSESAGGSSQPGYNAIPSIVSGNVPSLGFEATQTKEFGDAVGLSGKARTLQSMSVLFSSWGCQSGRGPSCMTTPGATFDVPMTFTVYAASAGIPGAVLSTLTKTVPVLYRPSASAECANPDGSLTGQWYNSKDRSCYNGYPQTVSMDLPGATLTDQVIWSVKFNTSHHGDSPVGETPACYATLAGCGYDSLNVGVWSFPKAPFSGTDLDENQVFRNGVIETGTTIDPWTGFRPLGAITTTVK